MKTEIKINPLRQADYHRRGWWGNKNLLDCWNETVTRHGEREYVCDDRGARLTYRQTDEQASRLAAWMCARGVKPGDTVAVMLPNWVGYCVAYVACLKAGAVVHLIYRHTVPEELVDLLARSEATLLICPTFFNKMDYEQMLDPVMARVPSLREVLFFDDLRPARENRQTFAQIMAECAPLKEAAPHAGADGLAVLMNTSGTTSVPKIVMLTHNNILYSERTFNRELGLTRDDVMFMPSPLHHATGFHHGLIAPMLNGARVVLQQQFDCNGAIDLMNREKCTYSMGSTPFIYDILGALEARGTRLESLRFYLCGGAHVPQSIVKRGEALGIPVCEVYGSTESVPHVFVRVADVAAQAGAFSGRPIEGVEVRLTDESGHDVPPGIQGEELSRGPNVFMGYLKDSEATRAALDDDGFFASGDLCVADKEGNIKVTGRKKDILVRGGENLSVYRIDEALEGCSGVADHAVTGWPDERLGERICAFIVPAKGRENLTLTELLRELANKNVPKYLWPERLEIVSSIPRTPTGKVRGGLLRARFSDCSK